MLRASRIALYAVLVIACATYCAAQDPCTAETCPPGIAVEQRFTSSDCSGSSVLTASSGPGTAYPDLITNGTCFNWNSYGFDEFEFYVTINCNSSGLFMNRFIGPSKACKPDEWSSTLFIGTETCFAGSDNTSIAYWCSLGDAQNKTIKPIKPLNTTAPTMPQPTYPTPEGRCMMTTYSSSDCNPQNISGITDPIDSAFLLGANADAANLSICYGVGSRSSQDSYYSNGMAVVDGNRYTAKNFKGGGCSSSANLFLSATYATNKCFPQMWYTNPGGSVLSSWATIRCTSDSSKLAFQLFALLGSLLVFLVFV